MIKKDDVIVRTRDRTTFKVIAVNKEVFTIVKLDYNIENFEWTKDYSLVMSLPNTNLEKLGFVKI